MANYSILKAAVQAVVKTNGAQAITGANLQSVLLSIINSIGGGGYIFKGVATPSTNAGTPDENVFYIGSAGTYANFGTSVVVPPTNIAVFKYDGTWTCEQVTVENGGVFDISAFNAVGDTLATYTDLEAALGTNGANIPEGVRKGGMSIKFVQSSDNKYVQYRLMTDSFNTTLANWQGVDDDPIAGSNNLVKNGALFAKRLRDELETYGYIKFDESKIMPFGIDSSNNWVATGGSVIIPVYSDDGKILLKRQYRTIVISFLKSFPYGIGNNEPVDFSSVYPNRIVINNTVGYEAEYDIPSDCKYICFSAIQAEQVITLFPYFSFIKKTVGGKLTDIVNVQNTFNDFYLNIHLGVIKENYINTNNTWTYSDTMNCIVWPVNPLTNRKVRVVNPRSADVVLYFLRTVPDTITVNKYADIATNSTRYTIAAGDEQIIDVPFDCNYIYSFYNYDNALNYAIIYLSEDSDEVDNGIIESVQTISVVDYSQYSKYRSEWRINTDPMSWSNTGASYCLPIKANTEITMTAPVYGQSIYAFLRTEYHGLIDFIEGTTLMFLPAGENITLTSPNSDCYLYLTDIPSSSTEVSRLPKLIMPNIPIKRMEADIDEMKNVVITDNYNLNQFGIGKDNQIWNWWFYPQAIETQMYRHKLIWGWCDNLGQTGVGEFDPRDRIIKKIVLKRIEEKDDHNACFAFELPDGYIGVGYHGNHIFSSASLSDILYIRKSVSKDLIDGFGDAIKIVGNQRINYAQCFYLNQKYYIFFRYGTSGWGYIESEDFNTWSSPQTIIEATNQFYIKFSKVSDNDDMLRMCMYEHPDFRSGIRMGFFDSVTGNILNSDVSKTVLGNIQETTVLFSSFDMIVSITDNKKLRLFDVAVTATDTSIIAVGDYTGSENDTIYSIARDGIREFIAEAGRDLLSNDYPLGMAIIDTNNTVICRGTGVDGGKDIVEIYTYADSQWSKTKTVFEELRNSIGAGDCRCAKPIVSTNGKYLLFCKGFYQTYNNGQYDTDAMIYDIQNDVLL